MTAAFDEAALRRWLVDYLVTNVGCSPDDIDFDASMHDLGVGSSDVVVLSGELSELLDRPVSPVEFWQQPTINALARFLSGSEPEAAAEVMVSGDRGSMDEPIAVIGLGCRFPGDIGGPESLWQFLCDGRSSVGEVPPDRWSPFDDGSPEAAAALSRTTRWGSFLNDIDAFDAEFFEISPREAAKMDPQQRLLLEVAHEALEHAGIRANSLRHTPTGVFAGACLGEYGYLASTDLSQVDAWSGTGGALSIIANRVSYFFDLRGPSVTVDTACSSSLVGVHLACQSLRTGDSNLALAAGVNLLLSPAVTRSFDQANAMSPTGQCHAFDASADGYVRGEGCGVAVLKRLTDALRDGDRVLAVVRGSAVNQDGRSNGLMAPNPSAQMAVLRAAYANAGVEPRNVDYVEAHGTGTLLGDPIEARALGTVLGRGRPETSPLLIGAVKSNLGHLEAAAGIAGFIKAVQAVHRGHIPANLHFANPNPHIPFENMRLKVVAEPTDWPSTGRPRRAGVSSFGFGGTNAHVVVEQAPVPDLVALEPAPVVSTLVVSGKTPARIASMAGVLAEWMAGDGAGVALADVAHTLNHHRARHKHFATVCARDRAQAVTGLRALVAGRSADGVVAPHQGGCRPGTVFVYSGQGSQWAGMGRQLLADEPVFAAAVAELEPVFVEQVGFSLQQVLANGEPVSGIDRIQPVLVGMQLALTELWRSHRVGPDAVIGHSMGEVTAAVVAGALTAAEGLRVIATRSRLMSRLAGHGAMALLELDAGATEELIAGYPDVTLAVYASPRQTAIAGPPQQVDTLIRKVQGQNRLARRIEVDVASHHPTIDPILPELRSALSGLAPTTPKIPILTTTYDHIGAEAPVFDAGYWAANLRNPVRFSQAVAAAGADHGTFIEISPQPLLTHAVTESLRPVRARGGVHVAATVNRDNQETLTFHTHLAAVRPPLDGISQSADSAGRLVDIPPTPWLHSRYWVAGRSVGRGLAGAHPLLGVHIEMPSGRDHVWQADVGTEVIPWLADHKVHGQSVMPVAAFAEMALAAGSEALGLPVHSVGLSRLEVEQMLALDGQTEVTTQLVRSADNGIRVEIHSRSAGGYWCRHAVGCVDVAPRDVPVHPPNPPVDAGTVVSPADFYAALRRTGAHHGQAFAALTRIVHMPGGSVESEIMLPDEAAPHRGYRVHPVMLDAALQGLAAAMPVESLTDSTEVTYLPVSLGTIRVFGDVGRRARCRAELISVDDDGAGMLGRVTLMDEAGTATAEVTGVYLRRVQRRMVPLPLARKVFDTVWVEASSSSEMGPATSAAAAGSWLVLADDDTKLIADDFGAGFGSPTRRMISADLSDESAVLEAFAKTAAEPELPPVGVIVFVGERSFDGTDADGALARARELIWAISATARAVVGGWHGKSPRLWLVTRNGLVVGGDESGDPAIGALKGLIRVLAYEHPDLRAALVDLDTTDDVLARLTTELGSSGSDDLIAWRGERRYVERLSRATLGARERDPVVRPDGSYILTGGLGGLGMVVARWLVDNGAGRVVLNGRTGPSDGQRSNLADLESRAEIAVVRGDIASPGVAERLVAAAEETGRPLRGVVHAAAVIDDHLVANLSRESLERVWAPKAPGALRLHEVTTNRQLDWWVGSSSVASLLGSPGQAASACANAWLDALVGWRRASGLPATTINWGQWSDVGIARSLTLSVLDPIAPAEAIEALESVLAGNQTRVGVTRLRLDRAAAAFPEIHQLGYFAGVVEELDALRDGDRSTVDDRNRGVAPVRAWSQMSAEDLCAELEIGLRAILAGELQMPESSVDIDQPFPELGVDSMMAMNLLREAKQLVGIELSVTMLWNHPTISSLAAYVAELLAPQKEPEKEDVDVMPESEGSVLDALFDSVEAASAGSESGIW
jgi:phthiocerol/phenolphthiocerol synthesis type-I polyketide synthase D